MDSNKRIACPVGQNYPKLSIVEPRTTDDDFMIDVNDARFLILQNLPL